VVSSTPRPYFTPGKYSVPTVQEAVWAPWPVWTGGINRYEYQEYFLEIKGDRCLGLTNLPPSCADCLEIWELNPPATMWACPSLSRPGQVLL